MSSIQSFYFVGVITLVSSAHVYGQKKDKMNVLLSLLMICGLNWGVTE